jgi:nucleotide-binding universal stress UspA family protein/anti-anti-sigma regulatory factor
VIACIPDGSRGRAIARIAGVLATRLDARVLLTTVEQPIPKTVSGDDATPRLLRHGRSVLGSAARELDQPTELRVLLGEPAERLLAAAEREAAQLVVVSAPPRRPPAHTMLLGNVHLALASAAPCPVVVIPEDVSTIRAEGPIVCGVDGSGQSRAAAQVAANLAGRLDSRLLLVHAAAGLPAAAPGVSGGHGTADGRRDDAAARILQHTAQRLRGTAPNYLLVEHGPAAERLAAVADRERAQLLVTGSRGRGPITSVLLGSVASKLTSTATQPLVIVPAHHGAARRSALAVRRLRSGAALLCVHGEVDADTTREMEVEAESLLLETDGRLVVDLSDASTIDRATARIVGRLARRATELGGRLAVVATAPAAHRALDRISHPVTDALDAALDAVSGRSLRGDG